MMFSAMFYDVQKVLQVFSVIILGLEGFAKPKNGTWTHLPDLFLGAPFDLRGVAQA